MTARTEVEDHNDARAKTAHWRMAVESERRRTTTMRMGKMNVGAIRGMTRGSRGKVTTMEMRRSRTSDACKALEGDI